MYCLRVEVPKRTIETAVDRTYRWAHALNQLKKALRSDVAEGIYLSVLPPVGVEKEKVLVFSRDNRMLDIRHSDVGLQRLVFTDDSFEVLVDIFEIADDLVKEVA